MNKKYVNYIMVLLGGLLALAIYSPGNRASIALYTIIILAVIVVALFYLKKINAYHVALAFVAYFIIFTSVVFYAIPTQAISVGTGPILNDNWWQGLNWIRENTAECATVATYWDPGHFIRAIARRPIVFGGASQNDVIRIPYNGTNTGFEVIEHDHGIKELRQYENGLLIRPRIKDIGTVLMTSNETLAVDLLEAYRNGCDELYFLATSDLVPKSVWWSYFATWDPTASDSKGSQLSYFYLQQARKIPIQTLGSIGFEYPIDDQQSIILCQNNDTVTSCTGNIIGMYRQGNQFVRLSRLIIASPDGLRVIEDTTGEIQGTIFVPDPSGSTIVYMPEELENSVFTKMFFFNGIQLDKFELVGNWGNEFKL